MSVPLAAALALLAAASTAALATTTGPPPPAEPPGGGPGGPAAGERIDLFFRGALEDLHVPGASVVVLKDGEVVHRAAYGMASVEYAVPAKPETLYLLASITKVFTATAVMMLVEEGKIALDAPVATYLDDAPDAWKPITIRMLLGHTAGLKDRWEEQDFAKWRLAYTTADLYAAAKATPLDFVPGTRWQYGDQAYFLLGMVLEKVSGTAYPRLVTDRIFRPCGMERSTTTQQSEVLPDLAQGYTRRDGTWLRNHRRTDYGLVSHFGVVSSVDDLARFDRALATGKLVKPETLARMWTPTPLADGDPAHVLGATYGMGWFLEEMGGHRVVQHGGASGTGYVKLPDDGLTVIVLTNLEQLAGGDGVGLAKVVAQAYVHGLRTADLPDAHDPDPALGAALRSEMEVLATGALTADRYAPEFARALTPTLPAQKAGLSALGPLRNLEYLTGRPIGRRRYLVYRARYDRFTAYLHVGVDAAGKIDQMTLRQEDPSLD